MSASAASLATPPSAAELAAAAIASRRSDPAVRGRCKLVRSMDVKTSVPATSPAPLVNLSRPGLDPDFAKSSPPPRAFGAGGGEFASEVKSSSLPTAHPGLWVAATVPEVEDEDEEELAPLTPPPASTLQATAAAPEPASWVSAVDDDEDEDEEELAPRTPPSAAAMTYAAPDAAGGNVVVLASPMLLAAPNGLVSSGFSGASDAVGAVYVEDELALETTRSAALGGFEVLVPQTLPATKTFIDAAPVVEERDGWKEVMPRRGPRRLTRPAQPAARRPVPAWLKGRCCRCLVPGHRAAVCCDPFRCSRCLENGHRACDCRNAWRPLSSLAGSTVSSPRQDHAPRRAQVEVPLPSNVPPFQRSWASVVSTPVGSLTSVDMQSALEKQAALMQEAVRPLLEVVDSLHGWMLALGGFLERAEVALGRLSRTLDDPLVLSDVGKAGASGAGFYGCFSPRVGACSAVTAPVMQVLPELQKLCDVVVMPPCAKEAKNDLHEILVVASPLSQALGSEKSDVVEAAVDRLAAPFGDGVAMSGLLPTAPGAIVAREVCDFLATLATAYPGSAVV